MPLTLALALARDDEATDAGDLAFMAEGGEMTTLAPRDSRERDECSSSESGLEMKKIFLPVPGALGWRRADGPGVGACADGTGTLSGVVVDEAARPPDVGERVVEGPARGGLAPREAASVAGVGGGAMRPGPGRVSTDDGSKPLTKLCGLNDEASSAVLCARRCRLTSLRLRELLKAMLAVSEGVIVTTGAGDGGLGGLNGLGGRDRRVVVVAAAVAGRVDMARPDGTRRELRAALEAGGTADGGAVAAVGRVCAGDETERDMQGEPAGVERRDSAGLLDDRPVGDDGAEAVNDAALRLSGALDMREPSDGLDKADTSCRLRALPGTGISGRRCRSAIMRWRDPPLIRQSREKPRRDNGGRPPSSARARGGSPGAAAAGEAGTDTVRPLGGAGGDTEAATADRALRAVLDRPARASGGE